VTRSAKTVVKRMKNEEKLGKWALKRSKKVKICRKIKKKA
jgi:hypothetical protein